jgi:hypothetical protein
MKRKRVSVERGTRARVSGTNRQCVVGAGVISLQSLTRVAKELGENLTPV